MGASVAAPEPSNGTAPRYNEGVPHASDRALAHGTRLELRFTIPGQGREIRCRALVRQAAPVQADAYQAQGVGVEFEGLEAGDQERLQEFIERNTPRGVFSRALS